MSEETLKKIKELNDSEIEEIYSRKTKYSCAAGTTLPYKGTYEVRLLIEGIFTFFTVKVFKNLARNIIGLDFIKKHKLLWDENKGAHYKSKEITKTIDEIIDDVIYTFERSSSGGFLKENETMGVTTDQYPIFSNCDNDNIDIEGIFRTDQCQSVFQKQKTN